MQIVQTKGHIEHRKLHAGTTDRTAQPMSKPKLICGICVKFDSAKGNDLPPRTKYNLLSIDFMKNDETICTNKETCPSLTASD